MRLLSASTDDNFELTTFDDENDFPTYAILSHTWSKEQEVNYDEVVAGEGKRKNGYNKLQFCQERAAEDGLEYFWVDTCCIDKTSTAELSEALNSMFRWYKQAKVCYVYLDDFDLDVATDQIASDIATCRWFTRGWCLQELLAPNIVRFYDRSGRFIGSKKTLGRAISQITRIHEGVLEDPSSLHTLPVAQRMSWASTRKTTRVEDKAYSLLGIFDVQMPMLYGEGEKAFVRLQEEIIKKSNDLSIFAWETRCQTYYYQDLFAPTPSDFAGCHNIEDNGANSRMLAKSLFSMTNRGLHVVSTDISGWRTRARQDDSDYILPLNCFRRKQQRYCCWKYLLLKKVGPGLFVRVHVSGDLNVAASQIDWPWTIEKEIYIVPKVTPDLCRSIEWIDRSSFEIRIPKSKLTSFTIQGLEPREAWDLPRSRFLTLGDTSFVGYLKICPAMAAGQDSEFFVVTFGFQHDKTGVEPHVHIIQAEIWQRYEAQGKSLPWMVSSAVDQKIISDTTLGRNGLALNLISYKVTVTLQTRHSRRVPVHEVTLDWKQRGTQNRSMRKSRDRVPSRTSAIDEDAVEEEGRRAKKT